MTMMMSKGKQAVCYAEYLVYTVTTSNVSSDQLVVGGSLASTKMTLTVEGSLLFTDALT